MGRILAMGLAAAVLPACHEAKIQVTNAGTSDAVVKIHWTEEEEDDDNEWTVERTLHYYDEWIVPAGQTRGETYHETPIDIRILRVSDGSVLLDDTFYYGDFRDDHSRIELTVYP